MRRRPLLACTAAVLAVHAALLVTLSRHGWHGATAEGSAARDAQNLVLLDAARVAALTSAAAPDSGASTPAPDASALASAAANAPAQSSTKQDGVIRSAPATGLGIYRPTAALDAPVRTRSAPDLSLLSGLSWSGLPLRIRLFIDANGEVVDVQVLKSAEQPEAVERVRQMFLATGFTAGIENGRPVPCYKDIEINIGSPA